MGRTAQKQRRKGQEPQKAPTPKVQPEPEGDSSSPTSYSDQVRKRVQKRFGLTDEEMDLFD